MYDVVIIGAGIMGAAVSRELSKYELKILLLDKKMMFLVVQQKLILP